MGAAAERSSAEVSRLGRHQQAPVRGGDSSCRRRRGVRRADYAGHTPHNDGYDGSYDPDNELSNSDTLEDSSTSSDDESVSRRKKMLEDALFGFFKKEALKSLKRDFSKFCQEANIKDENKRLKASGLGRDAYTVYSTKYFAEILKRMAVDRKDVISKYGFEYLLKFEKTKLPSHFIRWIVGCLDTVSSQIIIADEKIIPISKDSVHHVLGLPNSGVVAIPDKERGRSFIMSRFNLSELPNVTFFGNMITSSQDLSEEDTFICFMVIVMSCFLFPSSNDHIHTEFLFLLEDPTATRGFDMCFLVYEWIMSGINKYVLFGRETGRKPKAFDFCTYFLAVLYLDQLDFGVRVVENGVPRILAWKGNMIKHFSELDRKKTNLFGRRQFKKEIIQGIIDNAHYDNIKESGFENAQEAVTSNVLKFLSGSRESSIFIIGDQDPSSKPESVAEPGELIELNEKLKHAKSNISHTPAKITEIIGLSDAAIKHPDTETPECVITKVVDHNNAEAPKLQVPKKVKARLCKTMHGEQEFSLLNTIPAGVKERNSFFQFSVQHTQGTFTSSTAPTNTKNVVGVQVAPPQAGQSNCHMVNQMSPIGRTKLFSNELAKRKPCIADFSPTVFGVRQTELAKNADLVYNNLIGSSAKCQHQSVARAQIVIDVLDDTDNHIII